MRTLCNIILGTIFSAVILGFVVAMEFAIEEDVKLEVSYFKPGSIIVSDTFSLDNFKYQIKLSEIKYPDIVYKQAILESGWFTSNIWRENNNPFGFFYEGKYLKFDNWKESIIYYENWQKRHYRKGDYYQFLDDFYAEDSCYIDKLKYIKI